MASEQPKKHWKELRRQHLGYDPDLCPRCGKGMMITIEVLIAGRPSPSAWQLSAIPEVQKSLNA